jgi:hypothetical protein
VYAEFLTTITTNNSNPSKRGRNKNNIPWKTGTTAPTATAAHTTPDNAAHNTQENHNMTTNPAKRARTNLQAPNNNTNNTMTTTTTQQQYNHEEDRDHNEVSTSASEGTLASSAPGQQ